MFLQSYIFWQTEALRHLPEAISVIPDDGDREEILWKGVGDLHSDLKNYLDTVQQCGDNALLGVTKPFHRALEDLSIACSQCAKYGLKEILHLCASPTVAEAASLMGSESWGYGIRASVLLDPSNDYVAGFWSGRLRTTTAPKYALGFYGGNEDNVLSAAIRDVYNSYSRPKKSSLGDAGFKWLTSTRVRVPITDVNPLDIEALYPPGAYVSQQVWRYWAELYDSSRAKQSPAKASGVSAMSLSF